ncbi:hypothetical protein EEL34_05840 [Muribaculaceae bacterium Isolate-039 (Harlan)]|uniref:Uncharacterized protein n=1 Tax=Duncaniella muris TaxID=2094150 RepID=A0A2V1IRW0_9BACT|nr:hypothetical protein [Muribaculaceae bacterium S4]PWB04232.1 hypothetical protein C5O23_01345 [Duncaniella muris]ROS90017.1 hypothetical protein EEL34_05840 [Muribaculaceae bacterium Isolate-039 (Harlan)]ROS98858.1 hypothetical protein EEL40_04410 [Muribaculaceae bacterium Isolate-083 (Janvier)]ROS99571.1 hypothetical protein EEL37_01845 [Muribaculaceae bacterium Isolate-077 (Janvier)]ROT02273.1 hypothetical protein EEL41_01845 [Muribaculaceae bacterium Isolate-084 (Janvier)]
MLPFDNAMDFIAFLFVTYIYLFFTVFVNFNVQSYQGFLHQAKKVIIKFVKLAKSPSLFPLLTN